MRCGFGKSTSHFRADQCRILTSAETPPPDPRPMRQPDSFSFSPAETTPPEQLTRCDLNKHNRHLFSPEDLTEILHRFLQNPESTKARAFHYVRFAQNCTENQKSRFQGAQLDSSTGSAQPVDAAGDQLDRLRPMQTPAPIGATDRPADYAARISATQTSGSSRRSARTRCAALPDQADEVRADQLGDDSDRMETTAQDDSTGNPKKRPLLSVNGKLTSKN